jgi:hypothetical protein
MSGSSVLVTLNALRAARRNNATGESEAS